MPHTSKQKRNVIFVTTIDCISVSYASTWLCNHADSTFTCFLNCIFPCCLTRHSSITKKRQNHTLKLINIMRMVR
ncbi:hypothetical protein Hanom_Chr13g01192441 [Helianthus anomalus]